MAADTAPDLPPARLSATPTDVASMDRSGFSVEHNIPPPAVIDGRIGHRNGLSRSGD